VEVVTVGLRSGDILDVLVEMLTSSAGNHTRALLIFSKEKKEKKRKKEKKNLRLSLQEAGNSAARVIFCEKTT